MKWVRIAKEKSLQPKGNYTKWKSLLAKEANFQCVYCAIGENQFGGTRNFHVEHYRPKSKFESFENDFHNLFYSCSICNCFKSDDWPNDPPEELVDDLIYYIDPSKHDYTNIFTIDHAVWRLTGTTVSSRYMIEKLYLNRPQLLLERRSYYIRNRLDVALISLKKYLKKVEDSSLVIEEQLQLFKKSSDLLSSVVLLQNKLTQVRPYGEPDIQR